MSHITTNMFHLSYSLSGPFLIHDLSPDCNTSNTTGATCGAGKATLLSWASDFTPDFSETRVARSLVSIGMFCTFVLVSFGHCTVCPSDSDYPIDIFSLFFISTLYLRKEYINCVSKVDIYIFIGNIICTCMVLYSIFK